MCSVGSSAVFAVYSHDERPRETVGTGYDMEKSVYGFGLGVLSDGIGTIEYMYWKILLSFS